MNLRRKYQTENQVVSKANLNEKKAQAGSVDLVVEFNNIEENNDDYWIFKVALDTHSVDLDQINLMKSVYFADSDGDVIEDQFEVEKTGSGHHILQIVKLPKIIGDKQTISRDERTFKMIFKNIDGVEETKFLWDMTEYPDIFNN